MHDLFLQYTYIIHSIIYMSFIAVLFSLSLWRFLGCPARYCQIMFSLVPCNVSSGKAKQEATPPARQNAVPIANLAGTTSLQDIRALVTTAG